MILKRVGILLLLNACVLVLGVLMAIVTGLSFKYSVYVVAGVGLIALFVLFIANRPRMNAARQNAGKVMRDAKLLIDEPNSPVNPDTAQVPRRSP